LVELLQIETRRRISKQVNTIDMTKQEEDKYLEELKRSPLGIGSSEVYTNFLTDISNDLIKSFRDVIEKETGSTSGDLKKSVVPFPSKNGFEIQAEYYYKFVDSGVDGVGQFQGAMKPTRPVVSSGLYSFENLYVPEAMAKSIREWSGASIEQSYAIGVSIKRYGIKPKNITDKVITDAVLERIAEDLATLTGLNIEARFNSAFDVN